MRIGYCNEELVVWCVDISSILGLNMFFIWRTLRMINKFCSVFAHLREILTPSNFSAHVGTSSTTVWEQNVRMLHTQLRMYTPYKIFSTRNSPINTICTLYSRGVSESSTSKPNRVGTTSKINRHAATRDNFWSQHPFETDLGSKVASSYPSNSNRKPIV